MPRYITLISYIYMFILVRIFLLRLRCLFRYLSSFLLTFLTLYICIFTHIVHIVMFVFSHTSQYDFTHISQHILCVCIRVSHMHVYVVFSLYISLYSHTSHMVLYSHLTHFVKTFFAILVLHTFTFHTHLVLTFYFQKRSFTHICTLFFENIRI